MEWIAAGMIINTIGSIIGGSRAASAARSQANAANDAAQRQLQYDLEKWEMDKDLLKANREFAVLQTEHQARNEHRIAAFKDASNLQKYNYDMMIRNREQTSLNNQYLRSDDVYNKQITLNAMSAKAGREDEMRQLQEIQAEASFEHQQALIDQIQTEGKLRAKGFSGRSLGKVQQATLADLGRRVAMVDESLAGAQRNTRAVLQEISRDKVSADLAAYANKMLAPGTLPTPIVPYQTPTAEFMYPREIEPFDEGPQPVLGAYTSPSAAANQVWGATISSVAGAIGSGMNARAALP